MKNKALAVSAVVLLATGAFGIATGTPVQWKAKDGGNDHVYDIVVYDPHPWAEIMNGIMFQGAKSSANAMGGYLATPSQTGEASFIYDNLVAPTSGGLEQYYWLGAYCPESEQEYRWVNGDTVTGWGGYTSIKDACGEVQNAIVQGGREGAALQDLPLNTPVNGFIVEFDKAPGQPEESKEEVPGEPPYLASPDGETPEAASAEGGSR